MSESKDCPQFGVIERGAITSKENGKYSVLSLDRAGIVIMSINPMITGSTFNVGDRVVFFSFPDGTGKIVCKL